MGIETRQQRWAERAYQQVGKVSAQRQKEYKSFSSQFPAIVHGCGLCQALAFADAKGHEGYLNDLAQVLNKEMADLMVSSRQASTATYQRLTREVMEAATWLKRYAEATFEDED